MIDQLLSYQRMLANHCQDAAEFGSIKYKKIEDPLHIQTFLNALRKRLDGQLIFRTDEAVFDSLDHILRRHDRLQLIQKEEPPNIIDFGIADDYYYDIAAGEEGIRGIELVPESLTMVLNKNAQLSYLALDNIPHTPDLFQHRMPTIESTFYDDKRTDGGYCKVLNLSKGFHPVLIIPHGSLLVDEGGTEVIWSLKVDNIPVYKGKKPF